MNRTITTLIVLFLSLSCTLLSQERMPSTDALRQANDVRFTDINGVEYQVQELLDQGKGILIDCSAVWCGPCWNLHQSGHLGELMDIFGPEGNNNLLVVWNDGDNGTLERLNGGLDSKGIWTTHFGHPVNYPMVLDHDLVEKICGRGGSGFPSFVLVRPDGSCDWDVSWEAITGSNYLSVVKNKINAYIPKQKVPYQIIIQKAKAAYTTLQTEFSAECISEGDVSYAWTFEGATPATSTEARPTVIFAEAGLHKVSLQLTNSYGQSKVVKRTVDVRSHETKPFHLRIEGDYKVKTSRSARVIAAADSYDSFNCRWTFEGARVTQASGRSPKPVWDKGGSYLITLTATNSQGLTEVKEKVITVIGTDDEIHINAPRNAEVGEVVELIAWGKSKFGEKLSYHWEIEGAEPATADGIRTKCQWSQKGVYKIKLTITRGNGNKLTHEVNINIHGPGEAAIEGVDVGALAVVPNPASTSFGVSSESIAPMAVYSLQGVCLYRGVSTDAVDCAQWPNGVYVVVLEGYDSTKQIKLYIQH